MMFFEEGKGREFIIERLSALKKNGNRSQIWSNFYFHQFNEKAAAVIQETNSIAFVLGDGDFYRLYFYSKDLSELAEIIGMIETRPLVADYIASALPEEIEALILRAGFVRYAKMLHMFIGDIFPSEMNGRIQFADEIDVNEVSRNLFRWLDKYTGHFPDEKELKGLIINKQVLIEKKGSKIIGLYVYKIQGVTGNLYQWGFSKEPDEYDPHLALALNDNALYLLHEKGAKRIFLWVNENNAKIIKIHTLNGFRPDGLADFIYLKAY